ncbi:hypothetical protein ACWGII_13965 [Streptomyces sp. NPDC054855]
MTIDRQAQPRSVYRLLPSMSDFQLLNLDNSVVDVMRWQLTGSTGTHPTVFTADWAGDERWPKSDFPNGDASVPVLSRRLLDALQADLASAGRLLPVHIKRPPDPSAAQADRFDAYMLYLVERAVDCIDPERSSPPDQLGRIQRSVFRAEAVPAKFPAFRPTQFPTAVCWNGWMVDRLADLLGNQLEARLVWSEDPELSPHPHPWGF